MTDTVNRALEPSIMDEIFYGPSFNNEIDEQQQCMDEPIESRNTGHEGDSRYILNASSKR